MKSQERESHVADTLHRDQEHHHTLLRPDRSYLIPDITRLTVDIHRRAGVASDTIILTLQT